MRIGVAFEMPVTGAVGRQQFIQCQENVVRDGRVGVFIDCNRRRRMGTIYHDLTVGNAGLADNRLDPAGDINHLVAALRAYTELFLYDFHKFNPEVFLILRSMLGLNVLVDFRSGIQHMS